MARNHLKVDVDGSPGLKRVFDRLTCRRLTCRETAELQRRDITTRTLQVRSDTLNTEERSIEAVLATENQATVLDYESWELIDEVLIARGAEFSDQIVLLETHNRWNLESVLGSIRNIRVEGDKVPGRLHFAEGDERAEMAWQKVRQGHVTDVSVGYRAIEYVDIPPNTTKRVAGKSYTAGARTLRITLKWKLREGSLVPIGADEAAKIREGRGPRPQPRKQEYGPMNEKLRKYLESLGLRSAAGEDGAWEFMKLLEDEQRTRAEELNTAPATAPAPQPSAGATPTATPTPTTELRVETTDSEQARTDGMRAERDRQTRLRELAGEDVSSELLQRALTDGWDESRASAEFLTAIRTARTPAVTVGQDRAMNLRIALADAVAQRGGVEIEGAEAQRNAEQFRGIGLQDLARMCVRDAGQPVGYLSPDQMFQRAISTGSFAEILGTSATRVLMQAYQEYPSTLAQWAGTRDVADFKVYNDLKLGAFGSLTEVGDGGEIQHGTLREAKETHQAKTYGRQFAVTRKMWINDDLGAFLRIPGQLGVAAGRNIDDVGYALLYSASGVGPTLNEDSKALFSTTHTVANYHTGAGSALGDAGLTAGKVLMRKVVGLASELINVIPRVLLVPAALEHTALKLVQSQEIMLAKAGSTDATTYLPTANVHRGTLRVIVEPRLDGATNGATAWYLIADPTQAESLVIVFLRGQRNPTIERNDPANVLGIGWRMYHDVGVAAVDWRGINRGKGA